MTTDYERVKIDGERYYEVNDTPYPSVTTVTGRDKGKKKGIEKFEAEHDDPDDELTRLGIIGTIVHHRILQPHAIRHLPYPEIDMSYVDDELRADIETCLALWDQCDFEIGDNPYVEKRVASHEHKYAGTFDLMTNGTLVDLKTSKAAFSSHKMQAAAYWNAICEGSDYPDPKRAAIIVLHPDPEYNPQMVPKVEWLDENDLADRFSDFTSLLYQHFH